ncbi:MULTISPECIES: limonene-1,2-epoxide hydrolase family protein [Mycolicibacterium]|uniref:Limonene-1,2-epoxide hydrolase n=1 Tax=Mycolicibacterium senegalense TaxID=1796 RepID=A0A378W5A7_9MYCO|nr:MULTISPECIES: nuclear transport factor 2 family protein [Mycolicibacterium]MCV7335934.1 nuclear transport factor 2 family protein [Mycolicibacterium senegalense]MDR7289001.1 limonene-1,2-epoxide hydrolase [Mycolicibacterium senegalense]QZA25884.1 nuclear transport factor 2 family protein [Mycolicibacterium senegalense]CDP84761.1 limonene-1,2-epoxide hydrolase [Mycolicibacterium farcinogenes]SUA27428.1 limonene-1,2-epoxide hydrolase [Mycolicibacterium senegalense]
MTETTLVNESAESVVRGFMAAWPRWDVDELADFMADGAAWVDGHNEPCVGIEVIKARLGTIGRLIPGPSAEVRNLLVCDGTVMVERIDVIRVKGVTFNVEVTGVFDVDADGRITRWRDYYDSRTLEERIGVLLRTA